MGLKALAEADGRRKYGSKYVPPAPRGRRGSTMCGCGTRAQGTQDGKWVCSKSGRPVNECRTRK